MSGIKVYTNPSEQELVELLKRPMMSTASLDASVGKIMNDVRVNGDAAVRKWTSTFDKVEIGDLKVSDAEFKAAEASLPMELKLAIRTAYSNITRFHEAQRSPEEKVTTFPGVTCWRRVVPIPSVGLYVPGGTAPLLSTVLMLAIPARVAGCQRRVMVTPPNKQGLIHPAILHCARLCGVTDVFKAGGVQGVAAMAYGTESVPKVDKIFGPGNQYVTAAKSLACKEGTAIDMPAGPSELMVLADEACDPDFVAADLLSQAEHGVDSQSVLVTTSSAIASSVVAALELQLAALPRRDILAKALVNSRIIVVPDRADLVSVANQYAAEHLELAVTDCMQMASQIVNAGSVFVGKLASVSFGDYASGTNHTLPTNGHAVAYSGVSLDSFIKKITFQYLDDSGLMGLGPVVEVMAKAEGLEAHKNAVTVRLSKL